VAVPVPLVLANVSHVAPVVAVHPQLVALAVTVTLPLLAADVNV
jgi:hypothetical protein